MTFRPPSQSLSALLLPRVFQPVRSFYQLTLAERSVLFSGHSSIFRILILPIQMLSRRLVTGRLAKTASSYAHPRAAFSQFRPLRAQAEDDDPHLVRFPRWKNVSLNADCCGCRTETTPILRP